MPASAPFEIQPRKTRVVVAKKATPIQYLTVRSFSPFTYTSNIKRRARRIDDPVERLKYLHRAATPEARKSFEAQRWATIRARAASLLLAVAVCILGTNKGLSHPPAVNPTILQVAAAPVPHLVTVAPVTSDVWPVEQTSQYDLYSNGLRIENKLAIATHPRSYSPIAQESGTPGSLRTEPAGIVFHMTESYQAPFEPGQKTALTRIGEGLLEYVRNKHAYHFVIDRFGRVHRIVNESDTADHAGNSVWADSRGLYLNLNESFIGVAFEASDQTDAAPITDPQIQSARLLTAMLRTKYNLPAEDCVTHAQVSVNPGNMRIGWHTDWGSTFPFAQVGLPDNYEIPNPALYLFGFDYDQAYVNSTGAGIQKGLGVAKERILEGAAERGMTLAQYTQTLRKRYKDLRSGLENGSGGDATSLARF